mmetsp:Transcript_37605/g.94559  ORF Transcript_37605/g.94559 Transcript_37605/m.94559 type:complete len:80 (-) Transcript_37605:38-277(-)
MCGGSSSTLLLLVEGSDDETDVAEGAAEVEGVAAEEDGGAGGISDDRVPACSACVECDLLESMAMVTIGEVFRVQTTRW